MLAIGQDVRPRVFLSYSRREQPFAARLRTEIARYANTVWFDRDAICEGDDWREEIERGILHADEVVALICPSALQSPYVKEELDTADRYHKVVRAVVLESCKKEAEPRVDPRHFILYSSLESLEQAVHRLLCTQALPVEDRTNGLTVAETKLRLCRDIYPGFSLSIYENRNDPSFEQALKVAEMAVDTYASDSLMRLNLGLMLCQLGRWEEGLSRLQDFARHRRCFTGWYFLALHMARTRALHRLPPVLARQVIESTECCLEKAPDHPLVVLLHLLVRLGCANDGRPRIDSSVKQLQQCVQLPEAAEEFARFLWAMSASMCRLGSLERPIKEFLVLRAKGR
ncbi:toll/interleukin-1 receptor domain-containing protein [Halomonas sp. DN3]|uniref:toll/interleukin-1 receptor domain-containing protein n=1 Tax=Halomonas sp. DN3 TaxID=2953657 RepID=UPI00209FB7E3|nr:toll/interleukin-1 receptor domain-containing protein [Halomonas sp. DN3]USZ50940.1 toll/interleukin-1 receptor domain-containing protein [Halomonas sp. DN3]